MLLEVKKLNKSFGDNHVLKDLSFTASSGSAFGLLGRNGAGKTTTIRILMDVFKADSGEIFLNGKPFSVDRLAVGYLPEERGLYMKEKILRQMIYIGELRNLSYKEARDNALSWLSRFAMSDMANARLETLSKGNQQKIQLAVALINNPDLIVFDEPFSGLDPVNANLLKEIILEQVKENKLVFFSSHQMSYVEDICRDLAILYDGKIVIQGSLQEIRRSWPRDRIELQLRDENRFLSTQEMHQVLKEGQADGKFRVPLTSIKENKESVILHLKEAADQDRLLQELSQSSFHIDMFRIVEPNLEEIFVHYTGGDRDIEKE